VKKKPDEVKEDKDIYITPSGVQVHVIDAIGNGFYWMSNGAYIDQEILDSWKVHTKGEQHG
jgi:hypothetical protein